MKKIGVLGGIGPQATMDFEERVHAVAQQLIPPRFNGGYPPMMVYYHRAAPMLADEDGRPILPIQPDPRMVDAAARLGAWADFLVIPSNGGHVLAPAIAQATDCPLLSMIEVTLAEVARRRPRLVGVFGFGPVRVYLEPMRERGIPHVTIDEALQAEVDVAVRSLMEGRAKRPPHEDVIRAVATLRAAGADLNILGCTELPLLLGPEADTAPDLLNPAQLLAEAAVRRALGDGVTG
jgi:aspartate racemase